MEGEEGRRNKEGGKTRSIGEDPYVSAIRGHLEISLQLPGLCVEQPCHLFIDLGPWAQ